MSGWQGSTSLLAGECEDAKDAKDVHQCLDWMPIKSDSSNGGGSYIVETLILKKDPDLTAAALQRGFEVQGRRLLEFEQLDQPFSEELKGLRYFERMGRPEWYGQKPEIRPAITLATPLHAQIYHLFLDQHHYENTEKGPKSTVQCCAELLAAGADPIARNGEGETPLDALRRPVCPDIPVLEHALDRCGGDARRCLQLLFDHDSDGWLARRRLVHPRVRAMLDHRRAHEAHRDARLLFQAAAEGRPMELAKRLRLGKLAGGLDMDEPVEDDCGVKHWVTALEAARMGGHEECARIASDALCLMGRGRL